MKRGEAQLRRLAQRLQFLRAYVEQVVGAEAAVGSPVKPLSAEERLWALEYSIHIAAGGAPELWARLHPERYQRLLEVAPPRRAAS